MKRPPTILLATGDAAERALLVGLLARSSRRVEAFGNGEEVLAFLRETTPDLIIVDAGLPGVGGVEVCFRVKRMPNLKGVPVVVLSYPLDAHGRSRIERSRADRVVTKPLTKPPAEQAFKRVVRELLPNRRRRD